MLKWLRKLAARNAERAMFESQIVVTDQGGFVTSQFPSGRRQSVSWRELRRVEIRTNDSGPWGADVWWALIGERDECLYPQGATGEVELMRKLQGLPDFDNEQFISAMRSTDNATFVCWRKRNAA